MRYLHSPLTLIIIHYTYKLLSLPKLRGLHIRQLGRHSGQFSGKLPVPNMFNCACDYNLTTIFQVVNWEGICAWYLGNCMARHHAAQSESNFPCIVLKVYILM
jgi:hypothetical protein